MTNYLLDSNHASPLVTLYLPLRKRILFEIHEGHTFAIAVPILTETIFGFSLLSRATENLAEWSRLRDTIPCFIPDEADAYLAAELQVSLRRRGRQLGTVDALIAATALHHDLHLLTTDKDFDAVPDLQRDNRLIARRVG